VTTAPEAHTGQGLFFTSKAVDFFTAESGSLRWVADNTRGEIGAGESPFRRGTLIELRHSKRSTRELKAVFDAYSGTNYAFSRTRTHIKLFEIGTDFVSRSEAKRLVSGLEKFEEVIVDFTGVSTIGQGFADEVFRVWAKAHPETRLTPANMNAVVSAMVRGALRVE
jgi:hypothetical protein